MRASEVARRAKRFLLAKNMSTIHPVSEGCLLSVVCCLLSVVCCLLSVVCCMLYVVCCMLLLLAALQSYNTRPVRLVCAGSCSGCGSLLGRRNASGTGLGGKFACGLTSNLLLRSQAILTCLTRRDLLSTGAAVSVSAQR
jgi:hypothetical protein